MKRTLKPPEAALPRPPRAFKRWASALLFAAALVASGWHLGLDFGRLVSGSGPMMRLFRAFLSPNWPYMLKVLPAVFETIRMAVLGTTIGALMSVPVIFAAARNVTPNRFVYGLARGVMNVLRTIPELLFAALFVALIGLGPTAGILAITVFSFGIIAKLTSEAVEAIDPGPLEALWAGGASRPVLFGYAVVPQVLPAFISYTLYTFEVNVRAATVLGLVGAGGIGVMLNTAMKLLQYDKAASIILLIFVVVLLIEALSQSLRRRIA